MSPGGRFWCRLPAGILQRVKKQFQKHKAAPHAESEMLRRGTGVPPVSGIWSEQSRCYPGSFKLRVANAGGTPVPRRSTSDSAWPGFAGYVACVATALVLVICSCKEKSAGDAPAASAAKITLQLNWQPEPEFGGFYAAQQNGDFKKHGLDVNVVPGNAGTPTVQMIGAGSADFGIVSADELIISRARGNPIVALLAVYQNCPQGIMVHAARGFKTLADVFTHSGTLAIESGLPYSDFLKNKFGFDKLRIVPSPGGDVTVFLNDPTFSQQCFITSEPLIATKLKGDPQTFLVADAGYNPYTTVLATSDAYAKAHPDTVRAMTDACRDGWLAYLRDPAATNAFMHALNSAMDEQTFHDAAEAQKPLIQIVGGTFGEMTLDRWKTLVQQLVDLKAVDKPVPAEECFVPARPTTREPQSAEAAP
jgi:NitT/TauT family transport system substrate-binding protein